MTPKLHILMTAHDDTVLFTIHNSERVIVQGAERSMGRKWADGTYNAAQVRVLWEQILAEGGRVIDVPMLNDAVNRIVTESEVDIRLMLTDCEKQMETLKGSLKKATDDCDAMRGECKEMTAQIFHLEDQIVHYKNEVMHFMECAMLEQEASHDSE